MNAAKRSRVEDGTMSINKFNHEGYYDPTPYEALRNVSREEKAASKAAFRPLVYICSPFNGDTEGNIKRAQDFCRFALKKGNIPLAPHLMFPQFMDDNNEKERDLAIFMDIILMGKCQEVWVLGDVISKGMSIEIDKAKKRRQPIRYFNKDFEEVDSL
jgi:hypothetical protein